MKKIIILAVSLALAFTPTAAQAVLVGAGTKPATHDCSTVKYHNYLLKSYLRFSHHGADYRASTPTKRQLTDLASMRACMKRTDRAKYKLARGAWEKRSKKHAFYLYIDRITPYGAWAVPEYIVQRESHHERCAANPTSTAGGYYQQIDSTWLSALAGIGYHGQTKFGRYPGDGHIAACAPDWLQHETAAHLWAGGRGAGHWAATA